MSCKAPDQLKKTLIAHSAIFLLRSAPMFLAWAAVRGRRGPHVLEYGPFLMVPRPAKVSLLKSGLDCVVLILRPAKVCLLESGLDRVLLVLRPAHGFLLDSRLDRVRL